MITLANCAENIILQKRRLTRCLSRSLAAVSFLMLLAQPLQGDFSDTLRTSLLEKAISERLVLGSVPFGHGSELKPSTQNPRRQISSVNASLRLLLILPIRLHREVFTHQDGDVCSFQPSCSRYGLASIQRHGLKGILMASDRLLRCHGGSHRYYPVFEGSAYDPVP
jgi:putative component of membrane protein insertase Oxa1/YidC/SpoIIIJ protein YidD